VPEDLTGLHRSPAALGGLAVELTLENPVTQAHSGRLYGNGAGDRPFCGWQPGEHGPPPAKPPGIYSDIFSSDR
jgi:hypothetical protein